MILRISVRHIVSYHTSYRHSSSIIVCSRHAIIMPAMRPNARIFSECRARTFRLKPGIDEQRELGSRRRMLHEAHTSISLVPNKITFR